MKLLRGFVLGVLLTILCYQIVHVMGRIATLEDHVDAIGQYLSQSHQ